MTDEVKKLLEKKTDKSMEGMNMTFPMSFRNHTRYSTWLRPRDALDNLTSKHATPPVTLDAKNYWPVGTEKSEVQREELLRQHHKVTDPTWAVPPSIKESMPPLPVYPPSRGIKLRDVDTIVKESKYLRPTEPQSRKSQQQGNFKKPDATSSRQQQQQQPDNMVASILHDIYSASHQPKQSPTSQHNSTSHTQPSSVSSTHNNSRIPPTKNDQRHRVTKSSYTPIKKNSSTSSSSVSSVNHNNTPPPPLPLTMKKISSKSRTSNILTEPENQNNYRTNETHPYTNLIKARSNLLNDDRLRHQKLEDLLFITENVHSASRPHVPIHIMTFNEETLNTLRERSNLHTAEKEKKRINTEKASRVKETPPPPPTTTASTKKNRKTTGGKVVPSRDDIKSSRTKASSPPPPSTTITTSSTPVNRELEEGETISPSPSPIKRTRNDVDDEVTSKDSRKHPRYNAVTTTATTTATTTIPTPIMATTTTTTTTPAAAAPTVTTTTSTSTTEDRKSRFPASPITTTSSTITSRHSTSPLPLNSSSTSSTSRKVRSSKSPPPPTSSSSRKRSRSPPTQRRRLLSTEQRNPSRSPTRKTNRTTTDGRSSSRSSEQRQPQKSSSSTSSSSNKKSSLDERRRSSLTRVNDSRKKTSSSDSKYDIKKEDRDNDRVRGEDRSSRNEDRQGSRDDRVKEEKTRGEEKSMGGNRDDRLSSTDDKSKDDIQRIKKTKVKESSSSSSSSRNKERQKKTGGDDLDDIFASAAAADQKRNVVDQKGKKAIRESREERIIKEERSSSRDIKEDRPKKKSSSGEDAERASSSSKTTTSSSSRTKDITNDKVSTPQLKSRSSSSASMNENTSVTQSSKPSTSTSSQRESPLMTSKPSPAESNASRTSTSSRPGPSATAPNAETQNQYRVFTVMFRKLAHYNKKRGDGDGTHPTEINNLLDHLYSLCNYIISFYYFDKQVGGQSFKQSLSSWQSLFPFADALLRHLESKNELHLLAICKRLVSLVRFYIFTRMETNFRPTILGRPIKPASDSSSSSQQEELQFNKDMQTLINTYEKAQKLLRDSDKVLNYASLKEHYPETFKKVCLEGDFSAGIALGGEAGVSVSPLYPFAPYTTHLNHAAIAAKCLLAEYVEKNKIEYEVSTDVKDFM